MKRNADIGLFTNPSIFTRPVFPMQTIDTMIIPAAGYGTRMLTITKGSSKELLEVDSKPALLYALTEGVEAGISRVGIVVRDGKEDIVNTVYKDTRFSHIRKKVDVRFFYQLRHTGEVGAIYTTHEWITDRTFLVHYPDNIIAGKAGVLTQLIQKQSEVGADLVLLTSMLEHIDAPPCGLRKTAGDLYEILPNRESSTFPYGLRPSGIYAASPHFIKGCKKLISSHTRGEIKDRDVRRFMRNRGRNIYGLNCFCDVLDVGNPNGYQYANQMIKRASES